MVTCTVCGEDEFQCMDGFYYCTTCNTQSQDLREEEQGDFTVARRALPTSAALKSNHERLKQADTVRPWETEDGYQYIIKSQVEALIIKGANPVLKDIVFSLWLKYLRYTGVLPCQNEDQHVQRAISNIRPRDRDMCQGATAKVSATRLKSSLKNLNVGKMTARQVELMEFQASVGAEEFYEGDNPFEEDNFKNLEHKQDMTRKAQGCQITRMSLKFTLCFCYAGLLLTKHLVTAADIAMWAGEGIIPYMKAGNCIPEHMVQMGSDQRTFNSLVAPTGAQIRYYTGRLLTYLNITNIPDFNIFDLAIKYIVQLDLPRRDMIKHVRHLMGQKQIIRIKHTCARYSGVNPLETLAMAYIIIALKLFFTLDDEEERKISDYAKQIQESDPRVNVFVWDDWVFHMTSLKCDTKGRELPKDPSETRYIRDVESALDLFDGETARYTQTRGKFDAFQRKDVRDQLLRPIQSWMRKNVHQSPPRPLSVQPCSPSGQDGEDSINDQNHDDGRDSAHLAVKHFSTSTLTYRTNKQHFLRNISVPKSIVCVLKKSAKSISKTGSNYVEYDDKETIFPKSYDWLLKTCSSHIGEPANFLHRYVNMLEQCIFLCDQSDNKGDKSRVRHIRGMYPVKYFSSVKVL